MNNLPGTRQRCILCDCDTGRCEDDSLYADDYRDMGPLCEDCYETMRKDKNT
jgi:hypothetical protein